MRRRKHGFQDRAVRCCRQHPEPGGGARGGAKQKEGFGWFISVVRDLSKRYGDVHALDAKTGQLKARNDTSGTLSQSVNSGISMQGSLAIAGNELHYLDNRSDHEVRYPPQHQFDWVRTTRDMHYSGLHPHISIEDRLFVECTGGDLTIKIEDNTDSGEGIYEEDVSNSDQTLDELRKINDATNKIIKGYADAKKVYYLDINDEFLDDDGVLRPHREDQ